MCTGTHSNQRRPLAGALAQHLFFWHASSIFDISLPWPLYFFCETQRSRSPTPRCTLYLLLKNNVSSAVRLDGYPVRVRSLQFSTRKWEEYTPVYYVNDISSTQYTPACSVNDMAHIPVVISTDWWPTRSTANESNQLVFSPRHPKASRCTPFWSLGGVERTLFLLGFRAYNPAYIVPSVACGATDAGPLLNIQHRFYGLESCFLRPFAVFLGVWFYHWCCCWCCCLQTKPFFQPNDIFSTPSVHPDSS